MGKEWSERKDGIVGPMIFILDFWLSTNTLLPSIPEMQVHRGLQHLGERASICRWIGASGWDRTCGASVGRSWLPVEVGAVGTLMSGSRSTRTGRSVLFMSGRMIDKSLTGRAT